MKDFWIEVGSNVQKINKLKEYDEKGVFVTQKIFAQILLHTNYLYTIYIRQIYLYKHKKCPFKHDAT